MAVLRRWVVIDVVRILAIIFLLIGHISYWSGGNLGAELCNIFGIYQISLGRIAVTLFLVISGLVLELKYGRRKVTYAHFIKLRLFKIYRVYLLCLAVAAVFYFFCEVLFWDKFSVDT